MSKSRRQAMSASYLSHQGSELTFVSRFRPRQQALSLTLNTGDGDVRLDVHLKQARQSHTGDYICQAVILAGAESLGVPHVPEPAEKYAREHPRINARLRALSPALPNFRALSIDLSEGGMKLETEGQITPGTRLKMSLDLDIPEQKPIPLNCRVVWCQAHKRKFVVGLQFLELEPWVPPLLNSFHSWILGTGLKPKALRKPVELEFPEPALPPEEQPVPPAGTISNVNFGNAQVDLILAWSRGEIFRVAFAEVLVFRDNRGVQGAAFYDALDLEDSELMKTVLKNLPVSLELKHEVHHYQFLNRLDQVILEVLCRLPANYQLLEPEDGR